jgi:peptide/nickel transport system substrate-binding protein
MKRLLVAFVLVLAATTLVTAQTKKGPIVDKVYFDVRMDETIGMKDTAEGKTDAFYWGLTAATYNALPAETKAKLDLFTPPSGAWSLQINPIPNKAPYIVTVSGKTYFNPFAIREVRFAMNFLINRKQIVDEILGGGGSPAFTPATTGQPGTYKYNLVVAKFGFTSTGNEAKAIKDINDALTKASELPELKGKLAKGAKWWEFNGEPVSIKFLIRIEDSRLKEGRYVADQIEKAGIKVERMELDRSKCSALYRAGNPADYGWNMYTEGWGAGATRAWWAGSTAQMYAPWFGQMPGGGDPDRWNYENAEIDRLTKIDYNGQFMTADEYWANEIRATELGIQDAVRVYVANQNDYYVLNKGRYVTRPAYGLGDGINEWTTRTADVQPEKDGTKILRVTQFSARGSLFMYPWDPVGSSAMSDVYSGYVASPCTERASFEAPNSAADTPLRTTWRDVTTSIKKGKDKDGNDIVIGQIAVPESALMYDSAVKAFKPVGKGVVAFSKATIGYKWGVWHTGRPMSIADVMYGISFIWEWITKDGEGDKYYDAQYEGNQRSVNEPLRGVVLNADGTVTVYFDFNWPMDKNRVGATGAGYVYPYVSASGQNVMVSWEIDEALAKLVAEGGKSATAWSFSDDPAFVEVDVLQPKCLEDIKDKLQGFINAKYVPPQIKKWKSVDEAIKDYQAAIKFIDDHKNAYISNGPFFINTVDLQASFIELAAFRNAAYPYDSTFWPMVLKTTTTRIDQVSIPTASKDKDALVAVKVSTVEYPSGVAAVAGSNVKVKATLIVGAKETSYTGTYSKDGVYSVKIPAKDLSGLKAGSYTLVVETSLKNEAPSVVPSTLVIF